MIRARSACYSLYGFNVRTVFPFQHCEPVNKIAEIEISQEKPAFFSRVLKNVPLPSETSQVHYHLLPDCSEYLRLFNTFDFWISPEGKRIAYQTLPSKAKKMGSVAIRSSLASCLQSNVISFALIKRGVEPIHASSVVVNGQAVAFIADSGLGKSTLTASFVREGFPLLTDDILAVRKTGSNFSAAPGTPCLKLFSNNARRIFSQESASGPMYPGLSKLLFPLNHKAFNGESVPIRAFYLLEVAKRSEKKVRLKRLKKQTALIELVCSTYNAMNQDSNRLKQQMLFTAQLVEKVPMYAVTYPRDYRFLPEVRKKILQSLKTSS